MESNRRLQEETNVPGGVCGADAPTKERASFWQHEPRDPHADEWSDRHDRAAAGHGIDREQRRYAEMVRTTANRCCNSSTTSWIFQRSKRRNSRRSLRAIAPDSVNLVGNAIKFTERRVVVRVAWKKRRSDCCCASRCTHGSEYRGQNRLLFNKFSQVDASTTRSMAAQGWPRHLQATCGTDGRRRRCNQQVGKGSEFWFTARLGLSLGVAAWPQNQNWKAGRLQSQGRVLVPRIIHQPEVSRHIPEARPARGAVAMAQKLSTLWNRFRTIWCTGCTALS